MTPMRLGSLLLPLALLGCTKSEPDDPSPSTPAASSSSASSTRFTEGTDYVVLDRVRFLDESGFDRPVEAFSLLFPKGWTTEGGVRWRGAQECRGEMVTTHVKASSPDGAMRLDAMPARSFAWTDEPMLLQAMQAGAQQGGCAINEPFDASRYIEGFARKDLGAVATNLRVDESRLPMFQQMDQQANDIARQFGHDSRQTSTIAFGDLAWPDGSAGIIHVAVTNGALRKPDFLSGRVTTMTTTAVVHCVVMRFPSARKAEASKLLNMVMASHRTNPTWQKAKDDFMTQLGQAEHAGRMEKIRLVGEQSRAYAQAQSAASDRSMRAWETAQRSNDAQHKSFVQTIREVETWKDGTGGVELSAGYEHAWSRADGSYLLSNGSDFDPRAVFKDQAWTPMERATP